MNKIKNWLKKYWKDLSWLLFMLLVIVFTYIVVYDCGYKKGQKTITPNIIYVDNVDSIPNFMSKSPQEGLKEALKYYDIKYPEIVYAQALLETGEFTSSLCKKDNNLFGLYNSKAKDYFKFNHWTESVKAYKKYIQSKYKSGNYYAFLENMGYAEDSMYINKVKELVNSNK